MTRWEYITVRVVPPDYRHVHYMLADWGSRGWELATTYRREVNKDRRQPDIIFVFKRPISEPESRLPPCPECGGAGVTAGKPEKGAEG